MLTLARLRLFLRVKLFKKRRERQIAFPVSFYSLISPIFVRYLFSASSHLGSLEKPPSSRLLFESLEFKGRTALDFYSSLVTSVTATFFFVSEKIFLAKSAQEQKPSFVA